MTGQEDRAAANRLRRALLTFQSALGLLLAAERKLKGLPAAEVEEFWSASSQRIERLAQSTAAEVVEAFAAFSATGQIVAPAGDRRLINEAKRILAEAKA